MDPVSPERRRLLPSSSLVNNASKRKYKPFNCFSNYCKELKSRLLSLPLILLLIYSLPITVSYSIFEIFFRHFSHNPYNQCGSIGSGNNTVFHNLGIIVLNALFLLAPFCGWLSDTKIGRGNAIYLGLWLGWIGTLLFAIGCCLQYNSCGTTALIVGGYVFFGIAFVFMLVSLSLLFTNILPYGIDQLMNESAIKIRAFIHWYWLCLYSGYIFFVVSNELIASVVAFALFSFSLCLHFLFKHRFEHIPIPNPYKIVFKVLKFSLKTSRTRRQHRSAFTYWGEEPSRMDIAKERYGGCFSYEEVENVKTFLRIAVVLAAVFSLFVSNFPFFNSSSYFVAQFKNGYEGIAANAIWLLSNIIPLFVLVPLFELVILPLFPKFEYFIINPLKGLGLANILILLSIVSLFLIDLIGRITSSISEMPCFFIWEPVNKTIQISYWILLIPSVLAGTSLFLSYTCILEFMCSQSPYGMHGMIIGLFWFLHGVFLDIAAGFLLIVYYHPIPSVSFMSCTSWLFMIFGIITGIGLVVYVLIARWYVNRVRDTDLGLRAAVEEHWENRLITANAINDSEASEDFIISSFD
ncbi:PREDICTED: solute carrier family 15 member 4-like [Amphimedon queenslandica]|uniref:Major facilitator superfamily (MFS) profile domain-containing protein n=3 Tax=Amphimedon queenslandica TaxID=400682 RepID=A0A1X7TVV0_AMPQE|nr:PREDICTED: solute carrier family 15 member 4-like [Amphimedon queenslandica]|eukprot:XP_011406717.1 PREDICTED: solute carrier family 15 member 4-like [Amphimedon queenslandica]